MARSTAKQKGRASGMKRGKPYSTSRASGKRSDSMPKKVYNPLKKGGKTGKSPNPKKGGGYI